MEDATYQSNGLPNHYGYLFIIPDEAFPHPIVILRYLKSVSCGTLLDFLSVKLKKKTMAIRVSK